MIAFLCLRQENGQQVPGESKNPRHVGWIDIESVSLGEASAVSSHGSGGGVRTPTMSMTKFQDIASPVIQNACTNGGPFTAVVEILSADAKAPTLIYRLENVLIESYQPAARGSDSYELARGNTGRGPLEEFTITFTKWGWSRGAPPLVTDVVAGAVQLGRAVLHVVTGL